MKVLIFSLMVLMLFPAYGVTDDLQLQMLNQQIADLRTEYDNKYSQLQACAKKSKTYKIVGISALATTTVGIYADIMLSQKLKELNNTTGISAKTQSVSPQQAAQIQDALCAEVPDLC